MAEGFKPIETQEELNKIVSGRVNEEHDRVMKQFADYEDLKKSNADLKDELQQTKKTLSDTQEKYKDYDKNIADLQGKVHKYENDSVKTKVALDAGLPYGMASRLRGETEEEIKSDAEALKGFYKPPKQPMPDPEPNVKGDTRRKALKEMLDNMKEE